MRIKSPGPAPGYFVTKFSKLQPPAQNHLQAVYLPAAWALQVPRYIVVPLSYRSQGSCPLITSAVRALLLAVTSGMPSSREMASALQVHCRHEPVPSVVVFECFLPRNNSSFSSSTPGPNQSLILPNCPSFTSTASDFLCTLALTNRLPFQLNAQQQTIPVLPSIQDGLCGCCILRVATHSMKPQVALTMGWSTL